MDRHRIWIAVPLLALAAACTAHEPTSNSEAIAEPVVEPLPTPFTAEQIREEWIPGFRLKIRHTDADGSVSLERWTVVEADADSVRIEFAALDANGEVAGEAQVAPSEWSELRDHASFAPNSAERRQVTRETALGTLAGWLYTVQEGDGVVTDYFFAEQLPGAPIVMESRREGAIVARFEQIARERPE